MVEHLVCWKESTKGSQWAVCSGIWRVVLMDDWLAFDLVALMDDKMVSSLDACLVAGLAEVKAVLMAMQRGDQLMVALLADTKVHQKVVQLELSTACELGLKLVEWLANKLAFQMVGLMAQLKVGQSAGL